MRAANETRTRDPRLGKPMLYQLSYCRREAITTYSDCKDKSFLSIGKRSQPEKLCCLII